jgi:hypothetical protein
VGRTFAAMNAGYKATRIELKIKIKEGTINDLKLMLVIMVSQIIPPNSSLVPKGIPYIEK